MRLMIDFIRDKKHNRHYVDFNKCNDYKMFEKEIIKIYNKQETLRAKYYKKFYKYKKFYFGILKNDKVCFIDESYDFNTMYNDDDIIVEIFT